MLNNINLNLLRSLFVLLEECHVSQSAKKLNITQSAMSRQLSQLRDIFEDPLLIRVGNVLHKTPKAEVLQVKLNELFCEFKLLLDEQLFDPLTWSGEVSFASSDYVAQYIFPEIVQKLSLLAPNAHFNYHLWQPHLLEKLFNSPIKVASTMQSARPADLSSKLIGEDDSVCVMKKTHYLADKPQLLLDDILSYSHIIITGGGDKNTEFDNALAKLKLKREVGLKVPFYSAAFNALIKTDYLLIIPRHIARNMQQHLPISYLTLPVELPVQKYWLIWHAKYDADLSHQWIRKHVFEILQSSLYSVGYESKS